MKVQHAATEMPGTLRARLAALEREVAIAQEAARIHQLAAEQARESARRAFRIAAWCGATRARQPKA
jgi:hypothetical protein